ncbi:hypothetical protein KEM52_003426, partial [Ascosphaera acerosa]
PLTLADGTDDNWEIEKLLACRERVRREKPVREYLVSWLGFGPEEDRWYAKNDLVNAKELIQELETTIRDTAP